MWLGTIKEQVASKDMARDQHLFRERFQSMFSKKIRLLGLLTLALALLVTGCSSKVNDVAVADIYAQIEAVIKADLEANGVDLDEAEEELPGYVRTDLLEGELRFVLAEEGLLDLDLIAEGVALQSMWNTSSTEILVIKAKDEAAAEQLSAALEQEKELRLEQWATYLPNQREKVENTVIKVSGVHLLYATYENPDQIEAAFDAVLQGE
jgi:hypothetical protein